MEIHEIIERVTNRHAAMKLACKSFGIPENLKDTEAMEEAIKILRAYELATDQANKAWMERVRQFLPGRSAKNTDLSEETERSEGVGLHETQVDRKNEESEGTEEV